jgi:hypothetical protein
MTQTSPEPGGVDEPEHDPAQLPGYDADTDGLDGDPDEGEGANDDGTEDDGEAEPDDPHAPGA